VGERIGHQRAPLQVRQHQQQYQQGVTCVFASPRLQGLFKLHLVITPLPPMLPRTSLVGPFPAKQSGKKKQQPLSSSSNGNGSDVTANISNCRKQDQTVARAMWKILE